MSTVFLVVLAVWVVGCLLYWAIVRGGTRQPTPEAFTADHPRHRVGVEPSPILRHAQDAEARAARGHLHAARSKQRRDEAA